ncbi:putative DUF1043 family protein [Gammaproteobacteria bacterium]
MIQLSFAWVFAFGELFLLSFFALLAIGGLAYWRRRQDLAASRALVEEIKQAEPRRREATEQLLSEHYGYSEAPLNKKVQDIHRAERLFYQSILSMYLQRDPKRLRHLKERLEEMTGYYRDLVIHRPPTTAASSADAGELEHLLRENQKLSSELQSTMDVMGRMISDYASLFASRSGDLGTPSEPEPSPSGDLAAMEDLEGMDLGRSEHPMGMADQTDSLDLLMEAQLPRVKSPALDGNAIDLDDNLSESMGDLDHLFLGSETIPETGLMTPQTMDLDELAASASLFPPLGDENGVVDLEDVAQTAGSSPSDVAGEVMLDDIDLLGDLEALVLDNENEPDFDPGATVVTKR